MLRKKDSADCRKGKGIIMLENGYARVGTYLGTHKLIFVSSVTVHAIAANHMFFENILVLE